MRNIIFRKFVAICFIIGLASTNCLAATGMGMGIPCGGPFPPCPVPLDSSIVLLLLAGSLYGAYKIYHSLKKNPA